MLSKLIKAFEFLRTDVDQLKNSVDALNKVRPIATEGKPGRDGVSPSVKDIVEIVLSELPAPKDGISPDVKAIVDEVLDKIPKPRDGRDAAAVNVSDVAAIVLAKIQKPKDGKDGTNGPTLEAVVSKVAAKVKNGEQGKTGIQGKPGKNGISVTDVQLNNNRIYCPKWMGYIQAFTKWRYSCICSRY